MFKPIVAVVLAVTQVASWNALPLYLCVGKDGSMCVDLGWASCTCGKGACCSETKEHDPHPHAACGRSAGCDHGEEAAALRACGVSAVRDADACGCTHYPIMQQQGPVTTRGKPNVGGIDQAGHLIPADDGAPPAGHSLVVGVARCAPHPLAIPAARSKTAAPVVLRC